MANTLATVRAAVLRSLDRSGVTATESGDIDRWINQAIREDICQDHNWAFMETQTDVATVLNQESYAFPVASTFKDCQAIFFRRVSTEDWMRLQESHYDFLQDQFTAQVKGVPSVWARRGENYVLRAIPDASTYSMRVLSWNYPVELVADADTNTLLTNYSALVEAAVIRRGLLHYGEDARLQVWEQLYQQARMRSLRADRARLGASDLWLNISFDAGKKSAGLQRGGRVARPAAYSWNV